MGETVNLFFRTGENGAFELEVRESYGRTASSTFIPPYTPKQLKNLLKKLNNLQVDDYELRENGQHLFRALCGPETPTTLRRESPEQSVRAVLQDVIQRTLDHRSTVALTMSFSQGCEELVRYPWELLHNGAHFLLPTGIFTLTRELPRPGPPSRRAELPVYPPLRMLYISASPLGCACLDTQSSYEALKEVVSEMKESGELFLDAIEQVTFGKLVEYMSTYGGANDFNDNKTLEPCYVVHFDGHGAYGRLCVSDDCERLNEANARKCVDCGAPLSRVEPQTYLCFSTDEGNNQYVSTETLCNVFVSSDVRLAVFSACETAAFREDDTHHHHRNQRAAVDATLATALLKNALVHAVVAMPFSLRDDLGATFMTHFYKALVDGRTLEEALSRARQAMLPKHSQRAWFVPVLYRYVSKGQEGPVALLAGRDAPEESDRPLAHLEAPTTFVGREKELQDLSELLAEAVGSTQQSHMPGSQRKLRPGTHHLVLTGPAGMGKSALACEAAQRNRDKFPGGIIGISLQGGKSLSNALVEIGHELHIPAKTIQTANLSNRERSVLNAFRALANRDQSCLLLLDRFDEIQERTEEGLWHRFLCALPAQVLVLLTSHSNPATVAVLEGAMCHWYEYRVDKMKRDDLFKLFTELAAANGLDERIQLADPKQQATLLKICELLDGYPLGAELIFGTARSIDGRVYPPEAATRSLEEVHDELLKTHLAGIWAVLDVVYKRLTLPAQLLLPYLAVFKLPFSKEQIVMLVEPNQPDSARAAERMEHEHYLDERHAANSESRASVDSIIPQELEHNWSTARDELVQASFMQFDGRLYSIHSQVRHFAFSHLPPEERSRVHRVAAKYYSRLPHPSPEEWFAAFDHMADAGEAEDLQRAVRLAVHASWALSGRGHASELQKMLRRAEAYALRLGDKTGEGQIQCCLGAILRIHGNYAEAIACLTRSLALHNEQNDRDEAGWALFELAMLFREEGDFKQADQRAKEALNLFRDTNDAKGEAWMQMLLGQVSRGYGRYYEALGHFDSALSSFRNLPIEEGRDEGYAMTLRDRGIVHNALGNHTEALAEYDEAFRLFQALGLRVWQAWVYREQSEALLAQGKYEEAERVCRRALTLFREQDIRRGEGLTLLVMGDIERKRHNLDTANSYYIEARAIFTALSDLVNQARVSNALGAISFDQGAHPVAQEYYDHAKTLAVGQGTRQYEGRALRGLGDVARVMKEFDLAHRYYQEALAIALELDTPAEHRAVLHRLGELYETQNLHRDALRAWVEALARDHRMEHPDRKLLQSRVAALVADHDLKESYMEFCKQYGFTG